MTNESKTQRRSVFRKPTINKGVGEERKVSWLELYFDLFFVVVIYYLVHELAYNLSITNLFHYTLMFLSAWWLWVGYTYYKEVFSNHGLEIRLMTFLYMIPVAGLAIFSHNALTENFFYFVGSYIIARIILVIAWFQAGISNPEIKFLSQRFISSILLIILLTICSFFFSEEFRVYFFMLALLIDFITPFFTLRHQSKLDLNLSRLPERVGLFVIIVVGEIVRGVINYLSTGDTITTQFVVIAFLGFALSYGIWSSYFDFIADKKIGKSIYKTLSWGYLHIILLYSLTLIGAILLKIDVEKITISNVIISAYFIGGLSLFLISLGILGKLLNSKQDILLEKRANIKIILGGLFILFGFFSYNKSIIVLLSGGVIVLIIQMTYSLLIWKKSQNS